MSRGLNLRFSLDLLDDAFVVLGLVLMVPSSPDHPSLPLTTPRTLRLSSILHRRHTLLSFDSKTQRPQTGLLPERSSTRAAAPCSPCCTARPTPQPWR
jgi:hypothetical protein